MELILKKFSPKITEFKNGNVIDNILNVYPIYVINLEEDIYRKVYIKDLLKKEKVNYFLIEVKRMNVEDVNILNIKFRQITILGCAVSHLWCINNAISNNFDRFIIFEDDIVFHKDYKNKYKEYVNLNFDLLMLGACDFNFKENYATSNLSDKPSYNDILYYPNKNSLGGHANLYSLNFAKEFFKYKITNEFKEFDTDYELFYPNYNIAICFPNLIITELTTTNNFHFYSPLKCDKSYQLYISKCYPESFSLFDYKYITIDFIKFAVNEKHFINYNDLIEKYCCDKSKTCNILDLKSVLLNNTYCLGDILSIKNIFKYEKQN